MLEITPDGPGRGNSGRGSTKRSGQKLELCQFSIVVDDREQIPWRFGEMSVAGKGGSLIAVKTVRKRLETGDYSLLGHESEIAIERKSLEDLYSTLGQGRDRFAKEHERLGAIASAGGYACVLIEASLHEAIFSPPAWSNLHPNSVIGTWHSWEMRHRVPWVWCGDRRTAELVCYGKLEMFWRQNGHQAKVAVA